MAEKKGRRRGRPSIAPEKRRKAVALQGSEIEEATWIEAAEAEGYGCFGGQQTKGSHSAWRRDVLNREAARVLGKKQRRMKAEGDGTGSG